MAAEGVIRRIVLAAVLAGWGLRLHRLDAQSFWYDEGTSATVAPRDVGTILASAAGDIHPPLYYLLLHLWIGVAGSGEHVLRFPSVLVGTLSVALLYQLGRDVYGGWVGAAAAALLAAAPLPIWYSQEVRMYALAAALGLGSTVLLVRALTHNSGVLWVAYAVAVTGTLYSHYFAAAIPLAHALAVRRPRAWLALAAAGVAFLPWVAHTYGQLTGWPATSQPFDLDELVVRTLGLFTLGQGGDRAALWVGLPLLAAAGLGALRLRTVPLAYALVPLAAMFAVSLRRPFFHPKFVLLVAPAFDLLAAAGIVLVGGLLARRNRWAGAGVTALLVVALIGWRWPGVAAQWNDPRLARDDYRGLAADVARESRPGDAVVLNAPGQVEIFDYYFRGELPRYPLPETRPIDEAATGRSLEAIAERHERVWTVLWAVPESDPAGVVERWLDERMYKAASRWYGGVRLAMYVNPRLASLPTASFTPGARFGTVGELTAAELVAAQLRPGDVVPVTLRWTAVEPTDRRYTVFVHLIDEAEYLWGQRDSEPVGGARPTTSWRPGETIVDRPGVPVLAGTPPGEYQLEIGVYDGPTGQRLPVVGPDGNPLGDRLLIGPVSVQPGRVGAEAKPRYPLTAETVAGRLLGYELHPLGHDDGPPEVGRGETALLTLFWRAGERPPVAPERLAIRLERDSAAVERVVEMTLGRYPVERWSPSELVRDPYKLATADLAPGAYAVRLQLRDGQDRGLGGYVSVGELVVK